MNDEKDTQIVIESDPFSMLPNDFIRNPDISNDAKALYAIIKSYIGIPDFILYKSTLVKSFKGGDFRFRNAWKELKDTGYFSQIKVNTSKGFAYKYKLLAKPKVDKPHVDSPRVDDPNVNDPKVDKPHVDSPRVDDPHVGNQHSYKELSSKNDLNNNYYNNNFEKSENNKATAIVEGHGNSVVEKTNDRSISKGFDKDRFMNSEYVVNQILRLYEAGYYSDEIKKEVTNAIKYLADSCNCFGTDNINIINQFTDDEYGDLFNMALELANDSAIYSNVFNKKGFLSEEIKKRIARHLVN